MMLILLFALLCVAGVGFLFWQLMDSDRLTADKLRTRLAEEAGSRSAEPKA
jgi:hypothetical protein